MRLARIRARRDVYLREDFRSGAELRLPLGTHHSSAAGRARPDEKAAQHWPHRPAERVRLEKRPALQGIPCKDAGWQDRLRVPAAKREGAGCGEDGRRGKTRQKEASRGLDVEIAHAER